MFITGCLNSFLISEKWGSVRKIRFKTQVKSLIDYACSHDGSNLDYSDIKKIIEEDRAQRETVRLQITQSGPRRALEQLGNESSKVYSPLIQDNIAFGKGIGIFSIKNQRIVCSEEARKIRELLQKQPTELEKLLLPIVLDSKYRAYLYFLANLDRLGGELRIPFAYRKRTVSSGIKTFLIAKGFATDVASFFTVRDLLYDFGLINWRVTPEESVEEIYLTSKMVENGTKSNDAYLEEVQLKKCSLLINKSITDETFVDALEKCYLSKSGGNYGSIVDLLELRDMVCPVLGISDNQFNIRLLEIYHKQVALEVELSQGRVSPRRFSGLLIKAVNTIKIEERVYATYIRLRRRY